LVTKNDNPRRDLIANPRFIGRQATGNSNQPENAVNRNTVLIAAALLAASLSVPAAASPTPARAEHVWHEIEELEHDVNRTDVRDRISEREAAGLRAQIADLKRQYRRMNANGLTKGEVEALDKRIRNIRGRLGNERHDRDHHRG
jgi:septal ring factor EnvC (AmiA/AmiB activator)